MADGISAVIDDGGLAVALILASDKMRVKAGPDVRAASLLVMGGIKSNMPVDSGRARASWGIWRAGELKNPAKAYEKGASEADAVWEVDDGGLTITQGTNVEYVEALNNGHSQQMGAGFIDDWAQTGAFHLIEDLEHDLSEVW